MNRTHTRLKELIQRYLDQSIIAEEKNELWDYINDPLFERETKSILSASFDEVLPIELEESKQQHILQHIFQENQPKQQNPFIKSLWVKIAVAASVVIAIGLGFYFNRTTNTPLDQLAIVNGIKAGGNSAILTFADGKQINLSKTKTGIVINGDKITYNDGAELAKLTSTTNDNYTITTPKGGTYQLALPDGTKVWLNAGSTFKYATARQVELSGEAYFEVAKDQQHPFIVNSTAQNVKVLGTRFNISNYADEEEIKTTLLEGRVSISQKNSNKEVILKPGQQSLISLNKLSVKEIDTSEAIAWKNGYFNFNNDDIKLVMSRIAKWYDVELVYVGKPTTERFTGQISRSKNIGLVLEQIAKTNALKFEIEGRTIKVIQ